MLYEMTEWLSHIELPQHILYIGRHKQRLQTHLDEVNTRIAKQPSKHRKAYKGVGNSHVANYTKDQLQMDIGDMIELQIKDNPARLILAIDNILRKSGMPFVLNSNTAAEVYKAGQTAFQTMGTPISAYTVE